MGRLTVGKNKKLEKNHVPLYQADHRVWNLGMNIGVLGEWALWACSPMTSLELGAGHRWF